MDHNILHQSFELLKNTKRPVELALIEYLARSGPKPVINPYVLEKALKDYGGSIFRDDQRGGRQILDQYFEAEIIIPWDNKKSRYSFRLSLDYKVTQLMKCMFPSLAEIKIYVKCEEEHFPYDLKITLMSKINIPHEHFVIYNRSGHHTTYRYITGDVLTVEIRSKENRPREWKWTVPELDSEYHQIIISPEHGILDDYIL